MGWVGRYLSDRSVWHGTARHGTARHGDGVEVCVCVCVYCQLANFGGELMSTRSLVS